jgi:4-hydroxyphenylpyruvate dioxygenase
MAQSVTDNPLGINGFEFVEFTSQDAQTMAAHFTRLGFAEVAKHPTRSVRLFKQGRSHILLNEIADSHAADFAAAHADSASGMGFRFKDPKWAYEEALRRGAKPADAARSALGEGAWVIEGIGGSNLYFVSDDQIGGGVFADWLWVNDAAAKMAEVSVGLDVLDHLTHNVKRGQMRVWSDFYARLFGFEEQKYFNIKGQATGLFSQAMIAPDRAIRIPLNESQDDNSQIEEFLRQYRGEGIQHIAFTTDNIYATVARLRARGVRLQDTLDAYYDLVDRRVPGHNEDLDALRSNRILIDGDVHTDGILLQIFTETLFGPIFVEIIERKGNDGFGNGNFQALFESIELDQIRRGVIKV